MLTLGHPKRTAETTLEGALIGLKLCWNKVAPRQIILRVSRFEIAKPEAPRNWKTMLGRVPAILDLTNKATNLATKLAPYILRLSHS